MIFGRAFTKISAISSARKISGAERERPYHSRFECQPLQLPVSDSPVHRNDHPSALSNLAEPFRIAGVRLEVIVMHFNPQAFCSQNVGEFVPA